jgi:hypothetical protein
MKNTEVNVTPTILKSYQSCKEAQNEHFGVWISSVSLLQLNV